MLGNYGITRDPVFVDEIEDDLFDQDDEKTAKKKQLNKTTTQTQRNARHDEYQYVLVTLL